MTDPVAKTPEQLAAEAAEAATKKAAEAKALKDQIENKKLEAKKAKDEQKAAAKAAKEAEVKAKAEAKAAANAAKEANKMPEQNGVRRPKPGGACGKVWELADSLSATQGSAVAIAVLSKAASAAGINDSTIRTQYALWRKFNGVAGRVVAPIAMPVAATPDANAAPATA